MRRSITVNWGIGVYSAVLVWLLSGCVNENEGEGPTDCRAESQACPEGTACREQAQGQFACVAIIGVDGTILTDMVVDSTVADAQLPDGETERDVEFADHCSDGILNVDEEGVDCGGGCEPCEYRAPCETQPCQNESECIEDGPRFRCECAPGFGGDRCEINLDDCASEPCKNGAICMDGINTFTCECSLGFSGPLCEINIDECADQPCTNGGICIDGIGRYTCRCEPGFEGDRCEINIDECAENPCENGASCLDGVAAFRCVCPTGFSGPLCEINIDDCAEDSCANGAECVDGINGFTCACVDGFVGVRCEINVDDCAEQPCLNGGRCVDEVNGFRCECPVGIDGVLCGQDIDECAFQNGGCGPAAYIQCVNQFGAEPVCNDIDECETDNGSCGNPQLFRCTNNHGADPTCTDIDECAEQLGVCTENATCRNAFGGYTCECNEGFVGDGFTTCDSVCGDGVVAGNEVCDHGGTVESNCPENEGPCQVCDAECQLVSGTQIPAPRTWDGEAGDGLWNSANNWDPNGVPLSSEWVVIGQNAEVFGTRPVCRNVTIESGAVLRQGDGSNNDERALSCSLTVHGIYEPSPKGMITNGKGVELSGVFSARVPWMVANNSPFVFWDGAEFKNRSMAIRMNLGNGMRFNLSETGFSTLHAGGLLNPQPLVDGFEGWPNVDLTVDATHYDIANGREIVLLDFSSAEGAFPSLERVPFQLVRPRGDLDGVLAWDAVSANLTLTLETSVPPQEVVVRISPETPMGYDALTATVTTSHATARERFEWYVNDNLVAQGSAALSSGFGRGDTVRVDVFMATSAGESGPFSDSVLIQNSPPQLTDLSIEPASPTVADALTARFTITDYDDDPATLTRCVWQKWTSGWTDMIGGDNGDFGACANRSCNVGDWVRVKCAATDGEDESEFFQSEPVQIFDDGCDAAQPECRPDAFGGPPLVDYLDYSFWYWPTNHRGNNHEMHFLTGHYGFTLNEETLEMGHFGLLHDEQSVREAAHRPNQDMTALPSGSIKFTGGQGAQGTNIQATLSVSAAEDNRDIARMIDGGRFMNRIELPNVKYADTSDVSGRIIISSMPRHVAFTHTVKQDVASVETSAARIELSGEAITTYPNIEWLSPNRAVKVSNDNGQGWLFVTYNKTGTTTSLTLDNGQLVALRTSDVNTATQSVSLVAVSLAAINAAELEMYLNPNARVQIAYRGLNYLADALNFAQDVQWDETLGAFRADIITLSQAGLTGTGGYPNLDDRPESHNWYGRHRLTIDTMGAADVSVPLAMFSNTGASMNITGGVAFFRDVNGEPLGMPVQISKNWHDPGNNFYHFYSQPVFKGLSEQTMELTIASSRWGETAYAASHAQLSLIGYFSAGGHWDESALGCWGESITYDPDETLGRAMVDDVRPFLVQSVNKWSWTGNVGGADFLRYTQEATPNTIERLSRVRSTYNDLGPNLTNVVYSGVSTDGKIEAHLTSQLGRTDDLVRNYYHLEYTFLEDVRYRRLAFFQMAADRYGDNGYARHAYGNKSQVLSDVELCRPTLGDPACTVDSNCSAGSFCKNGTCLPDVEQCQTLSNYNTTGYINDDVRGIALTGEAPWVLLYQNEKEDEGLPEKYANIGFVVRDFSANIGGVEITTPHINIHRTRNGQIQMAYELGLPHEAGSPWCGDACQGETRMIPAGSTVRATIEYLVIPADKSRYYGLSDYLVAMAPEDYQSTAMALKLAADNQLKVDVSVGELERTYPIEVQSVPGALAAEFSIDGGLGYVPITIKGLIRHDGWRLEQMFDGAWQRIDQSVHGNDFWQTRYDGLVGAYELTFNVHNRGRQMYRLIWSPDP